MVHGLSPVIYCQALNSGLQGARSVVNLPRRHLFLERHLQALAELL